ncbi:MAG: ABC transporter substrate-binding protein [Chloroflexi bacterium]|nr:MAG: ABC transporter substrate-binding protein [Chloroflexota bacterium]MBL1194868.1 ABC transporter substrate-binding protein [Chloroflexota bacterium]NOH12159.1 ABC transporter substrate-binding protein [Chloroflexota bacterium]
MKISNKWLPILLILSLLLVACGTTAVAPEVEAPLIEEPQMEEEPVVEEPDSAPAEEMVLEFTDDLGRTIVLEELPTAIVSTAPSITESLFAMGAGDLVIGRDEYSIYPEAAFDVESIGPVFGDLPLEVILAMEPDLVIVAQIIPAEQVTQLEELGLTVYWQANPLTFDDLYDNLRSLGQLVGHENDAQMLISSLQDRVAAVVNTLEGVEEKPVVFYELDATDPDNPWTSGAGTFIDTIFTMAGGVNAGAELEGDFTQIGTEALIAINPAVIILGDADFGVTPEMVMARAGWDAMTAVQTGAVYPIDSNTMSVPGPRLVDGLETVARFLHPDLFE